KGVENVYVVYRRTKALAPAEREEIELAEKEGIKFHELTAPVSHLNGILKCQKMKLGEKDASGRRSPIPMNGEFVELKIDSVIAAIGEKVETSVLEKNGIEIDSRGNIIVSDKNETNIPNVFMGGDALRGPATIVEALADGIAFADEIMKREKGKELFLKSFEDLKNTNEERILDKKAVLATTCEPGKEKERCLECNYICENCAEVCPNRANVAVKIEGFNTPQILHLDPLCNECGNCETFCPYSSAPYKDKFTYFSHVEDFDESHQEGFLFGDGNNVKIRLGGKTIDTKVDGEKHDNIPERLYMIIRGFRKNYSYML
ncbi:MAG: FAD-dependent oxidoreductase, partial [Fusobacteriaceae bacterium]